MNSLAYTPESSQAGLFLGDCKRCGSPDLFIRPEGPHLGLFCRPCGLWQKWISKATARRYQNTKPYPEVSERIGPAAAMSEAADLNARMDALERKFNGYDISLNILVRAVLACGVLQGRGGAPDVDVNDERVAELVQELEQNEGER